MAKKMKRFSEGEEVEFETKQGKNEAIDKLAGIRERAMAAIAAGGQKEAPVEKKVVKKTTVTRQPESDREEHSSWMREYRKQEATDSENKRESQALFNKKPVDTMSKADPEKVRKAYIESAKYAKSSRMASGGMARKSASARADGIAIRGKTRA
jgi:hypothetical protein